MRADFVFKPAYDILDLLQIMSLLRGENGCAWDREQDHHSIRNNFIEETYEAIEAIDREDATLLREELGDVLLQVVFHAQMESEKGVFDFRDVCDGICRKLIHRHPHVFGQAEVTDARQVLENWEEIKRQEKAQDTATSTLEGVSPALPALIRSSKVQHRAAKVGFDYPQVEDALAHLKSEIAELEAAMTSCNDEEISEELGDLLFSVVNVARKLGRNAEEALYRSTDKFIRRFSVMEQLAAGRGKDLTTYTLEQLDRLWESAKEKEINGGRIL